MRFMRKPLIPPPTVLTPHTRSSVAWSWMTAPVAPSSRAMIPSTVGSAPPPGCSAFSRSERTSVAAPAPMSDSIWRASPPRTSAGSITEPTSIMMSTSRAGSEKTV